MAEGDALLQGTSALCGLGLLRNKSDGDGAFSQNDLGQKDWQKGTGVRGRAPTGGGGCYGL